MGALSLLGDEDPIVDMQALAPKGYDPGHHRSDRQMCGLQCIDHGTHCRGSSDVGMDDQPDLPLERRHLLAHDDESRVCAGHKVREDGHTCASACGCDLHLGRVGQEAYGTPSPEYLQVPGLRRIAHQLVA